MSESAATPRQDNTSGSSGSSSSTSGRSRNSNTSIVTESLRVQVRAKDGTGIWFRLKRNQKLKSLIDYYNKMETSKHSNNNASIQFVYKGLYLQPTDTPGHLHMEDKDVIECVSEKDSTLCTTQSIKIVIRDQNDIEIWFKIRLTQRFKTMFSHYGRLVRYPTKAFQYSHKGVPLTAEQTSASVGLKEGDVIDCWSPFPASAA